MHVIDSSIATEVFIQAGCKTRGFIISVGLPGDFFVESLSHCNVVKVLLVEV